MTKVNVIKANAHKYGVSALCKVLNISRSTYYYEAKVKRDETELTAAVVDIFKISRNNYGICKIKKELAKQDMVVSRRRIMKQEGLVSSYTAAQFRPQQDTCNEAKTANVVDRQFRKQPYRNVVVSDLTYVRVWRNWNYTCILVELFNCEIVGYSAGSNKTADLVKQAFQTVTGDLRDIRIFHTDRGNEFKNNLIDETLESFEIKCSLSHKGCPYDNAVAEATFKIIKTEFVRNQRFHDMHQLQIQLSDYINWFNNHRDSFFPQLYDTSRVPRKHL